MTWTKTIAIVLGGGATTLFAANLQVGRATVEMRAGETIEVPLTSTAPIASDLAAKGTFEPGDIRFTAGPGCHLSADNCTLMITASPTSKSYREVRVVVSESAGKNTAGFALSVTGSATSAPTKSPEVVSTSMRPVAPTPVVKQSEDLVQRSGNALFYAVAEPRPGFHAEKAKHIRFTPATNGPSYQIVELTNDDVPQSLSVSITGSGASSFTLDDTASNYGENKNCAALTRIASGESCLLIIKGEVGNPRQAPQTAKLTLRGDRNNVATFTLRDTTFVYAAGGFDTLGSASVAGGNLLAQCTAGTCSNALQGTTGDNFSTTSFSVGQWINALAITSTGNLLVGGVFGAIGGATSGASSGTAALLAQCTPGSVVGNACINQMGEVAANRWAFSNAYIDGIAPPDSGTGFFYLAGDFTNIRATSVTASQKMVAKCAFSGAASNQNCNNYLGISTRFANNTVVAVDFLNAVLAVGGLFTQVSGFPGSAPSSGTTFATCTTTTCSQGMSSDNPNGSILCMTNDGTSHYMGGTFTSIGGHVDSSGGFPLVACTPGATTVCSNALSGSNDANGFIEGLTHSGGNLYVGGKFTTIGGATPVAGNMLAECAIGGGCSNFVTDVNPFATGSDWGGVISAVAVGTQTSIMAD